jgi:hypothetical protein
MARHIGLALNISFFLGHWMHPSACLSAMMAFSNRFAEPPPLHSYFPLVKTPSRAANSAQYCIGSTQMQHFDSMVFFMIL